ncbi:decaprenyl-phosphate phosphoribosyltransferase [Paenibacillus filicis]|uniref:Decaprenyl-phosphate phosphoribosyltransferase n=1 Tax=Paenibacillus filicis TaxID=669464 RepID=A0ABU9DSB8_9BACL
MEAHVDIRRQQGRKNYFLLMLEEMRWKQWTKNLLVFAALVFSIDKSNSVMVVQSVFGFVCYCLISSCVYVLNDYLDRHADRQHPIKKFRPIASGQLNPIGAIVTAGGIFLITIMVSLYLNLLFGVLLLVYFIINVCYSLKVKHIVILDIMCIAAGFVLRAIGGAIIINVYLTPWFLVCTMLLALFLAVNKRRHELILLDNNSTIHRKVLQNYTVPMIDQMNNVVTSATIVSYALFTFTSGRTLHLMWTIPFVMYGMFRYLYLVHIKNEGGAPDKLLFTDKPLLVTVIMYACLTISVLYMFE